MILVKYSINMPKIVDDTEFCAIVPDGTDGTTEEWFLASDDAEFVEELGKCLKGRALLSLYREVPIEIKG